tara:strand:- start:9885 stop:9986 length:102 start_codon:yes stop_codon:yes gene_type:complete
MDKTTVPVSRREAGTVGPTGPTEKNLAFEEKAL